MVPETGSFEGTYADPDDVMAATAQSSGAKLGGARHVNIDARSAAVAAARARSPQSAAADRVAAAAPPVQVGAAVEIEGMGHQDASTEQKEEAARHLGGRSGVLTVSRGRRCQDSASPSGLLLSGWCSVTVSGTASSPGHGLQNVEIEPSA